MLHAKKIGQQVEGGGPAPLLLSGETSPGVLSSALDSQAQERHGSVKAVPEDGHKNDYMAGTLLLWKKRLRGLCLFSLEKRMLQRELIVTFQYINDAYKKDREQLFANSFSARGSGFKAKKSRFRLHRRKNVFIMKVVGHWNRRPGKVMPHCWNCSRSGWMGVYTT